MSDLVYDITDKDTRWIQEQYRARFGVVLSKEEAFRKMHKLVRQMDLIYRPVSKQQVEQLTNENEDTNGTLRAADS